MRVTPNITAQNSLYNIQNARTRLNDLQEKLASGQNVNRPSDDPVTARLLMGINNHLAAADQYQSNISKGNLWYQMADLSFTTMYNSMSDIRSTISTAASGVASADDRNNAIYYLQLMKQTLVDLGNTDSDGVFIFGGTNNLKPPFMPATGDVTTGSTTITNIQGDVSNFVAGMEISGPGIADGTKLANPPVNAGSPPSINLTLAATATNTGSGFTVYGGDAGNINVEINRGVTEAINIPGNTFLTAPATGSEYGSIDILKTLDQLMLDLGANNISGITTGLEALDDGAKQMVSAQTDLESRQVRFNAANTMNQNVSDNLKMVISNTQTVDYAKLGIELQNQQTAFEATLSATAKITRMSLLDYM